MPELIEVEAYRRLAERVVGRTVSAVPTLDPLGLRGADAPMVRAAVVRRRIEGTARLGKLLVLDTDGPRLGLRFGMTGRLLVDGAAVIDRLEYSSGRDDPAWDRVVLSFVGGGDLRIRDPRRLGGFELDPEIDRLGPDAATITSEALGQALEGSRTAVKARLLDQRRIAGLGNLLVDETLWRAGIDPRRRCVELTGAEVVALAEQIVDTVRDLTARGGSHTGDLQVARAPGASCPADGAALERGRVGGRTTFWCPRHQR